MRRSSYRVISVCFGAVIFISVLLPCSLKGQQAPKPTATVTHSEPIKAQVIKRHHRHRRHKCKTTATPPREIRQPSDDDKKLREIKEQKNKVTTVKYPQAEIAAVHN